MHSEAAQVKHEHAAPTHIKEGGNTSPDGCHHRRPLAVAGASSHDECDCLRLLSFFTDD